MYIACLTQHTRATRRETSTQVRILLDPSRNTYLVPQFHTTYVPPWRTCNCENAHFLQSDIFLISALLMFCRHPRTTYYSDSCIFLFNRFNIRIWASKRTDYKHQSGVKTTRKQNAEKYSIQYWGVRTDRRPND